MKLPNKRQVILMLADSLALGMSCIFAYFLMDVAVTGELILNNIYPGGIIYLVCSISCLYIFGTYDTMWRYANIRAYGNCVIGLIVSNIFFFVITVIIKERLTYTSYVLAFSVSVIVVTGMRVFYKCLYDIKKNGGKKVEKQNTLIVGAGMACKILLDEMDLADTKYKPVCIVDDDLSKLSRNVNGIKVFGTTQDIKGLCDRMGVRTIFVAIPSANDDDRKRILQLCMETGCEVKIVPYLHEIVSDQKLLNQARNIQIEDLLGREAINLEFKNVRSYVSGKVCMVTGGGGSIGSELCRQLMSCGISRLVIVDIYENNAYDIQQELVRGYEGAPNLSVEIASVRDYDKMSRLFAKYRPEVVFHAAAHKHVPLMENNPEEAVKNNISGTFNVAKLAERFGVKKMVLISTDKAVNPTNVMGATKRCCEMIMQYMAQRASNTEFVAVRFGNVLGTNGSVIPLFEKQIKEGGPVTVTHPDIIRYFMTIPEAVSLVLQAGHMAKGGEIFVLDMGAPVKITTLAENLIRLYGYEPYINMKIEFTGLRPGEKLFEELLMDEEGLQSTENHKIFIGNQIPIHSEEFLEKIDAVEKAAALNDYEMIVDRLCDLVPTFVPERKRSKIGQRAAI